VSGRQVGVMLASFDKPTAAARARRPLDAQLRSDGAVVLDSVILKVNAKHKVTVYDPRRVRAGALTAALTWGLFGLVTGGGTQGLIISATVGAIVGGAGGYVLEHIPTKAQLARIGARLPARTSALLTFAETSDPHGMLAAAAARAPVVASAAAIGEDLATEVFAPLTDSRQPPHPAGRAELPGQPALLSMIVFRYPGPGTAREVAARIAADGAQAERLPQVELILSTDRSGGRHVADPGHGVAAMARSDVISWGGFGLVFGAIAGAAGGGFLGFLNSAFLTGLIWGLFGLLAGALYGLWAGRAISARRLKGIGVLLIPDTSMLVAWADGPASPEALTALAAPGSQRLVLCFTPLEEGGAVLAT
jgi:uncharacterized membrane protein